MKSGVLQEATPSIGTAPTRLLIVEHSKQDAELMVYGLREAGLSIQFRLAEIEDEFLRALSEEHFDAILSDYRLPRWSGLDALKALKRTNRDIPFILVTGTLGEEAAV